VLSRGVQARVARERPMRHMIASGILEYSARISKTSRIAYDVIRSVHGFSNRTVERSHPVTLHKFTEPGTQNANYDGLDAISRASTAPRERYLLSAVRAYPHSCFLTLPLLAMSLQKSDNAFENLPIQDFARLSSAATGDRHPSFFRQPTHCLVIHRDFVRRPWWPRIVCIG
jgi:hypothetical protein